MTTLKLKQIEYRDAVYDYITLSPLQVSLLDTPEMQRLDGIKQLGFKSKAYRGANHTRIEHCVGASYLASQIANQLNLPEKKRNLIEAAAILHDIGHLPYSHTIEEFLDEDHEVEGTKIIKGTRVLPLDSQETGKIPHILGIFNVDPEEVSQLITGDHETPYLQNIIRGCIDVDQTDYLLRDSYHTGKRAGNIVDKERLIKAMVLQDDKLCIKEKSMDTVEDLIFARAQMYRDVYMHHTARSMEAMLVRAIKPIAKELPDLYSITEGELLSTLGGFSDYHADIVRRINYRTHFKRAFTIKTVDKEKHKDKLKELMAMDKVKLEDEIAKEANVELGYVVVDFASKIVDEGEPRIGKADQNILRHNNQIVPLQEISNISPEIARRINVVDIIAVYTPEEFKDRVNKAVMTYF